MTKFVPANWWRRWPYHSLHVLVVPKKNAARYWTPCKKTDASALLKALTFEQWRFLQQNRYPALVTLFKNLWKLGTPKKCTWKVNVFVQKTCAKFWGGHFEMHPISARSLPTQKLVSNTKAWSIHLLFCHPILRAHGRHFTCTGRETGKTNRITLERWREIGFKFENL